MTLSDGAMVGPYRISRLLGRGGMAVVYEATQESIGRTVALKLVSPDLTDPDFVDRFRHEGRMQAALDHPHVVAVYEAGSSEHGPYLAMRLVRGSTLAGLIDDGALTSARTLDLLDQVAGALDAAHAAGLVHRDVKPRNVLVEGTDHAYLADFGLTRLGDAGGATLPGQFVGTMAYAAPEVISGAAPGPAADRYALAAVLFECLTGTPVFPRPTHSAVLYAHTHEPPPRVGGRREGIPAALDDVLIQGLAKDPADRPATGVELLQRARAALTGVELGPPPPRVFGAARDETTAGQVTRPSAERPPAAPAARSRRAWLLAGVAGLAVGGGAVALLGGGDAPKTTRAATPAALPAPPAGSVRLGSTLAAPGTPTGCDGWPPTAASPGCTIFQDRLPGDATLVVPRNGVVRRWGVRSARGEFALTLMRRRDQGYLQISRSRNQFVADGGPHLFATDLAVERGDRLGLLVVGGSGVGLRAAPGATTGRFKDPLGGLIQPQRPAAPGELLLRADYVPGGRQRQPEQLRGAAAAAAPDGMTLVRSVDADGSDPRAHAELVLVRGRGALDLFRAGRRTNRVFIDDLRAPVGADVRVDAFLDPKGPGSYLYLTYGRANSDRLLHHYFVVEHGRVILIG